MAEPYGTLTAQLERSAARHGRAPALRFLDNGPRADGEATSPDTRPTAMDHARLARRAQRAAARLWHEWGLRPGDRIAWLGLNHPDMITLLYAAARLGCALVPLNHRLAMPEWQRLLADCRPSALVHDRHWAGVAGSLMPGRHHRIEALCARPVPQACPADRGRPDAPALLVYTSGTTGTPKGAVHTQSQLLANMGIAGAVQGITPRDRVLTVLPLFHVGGLCIQTLPALMAGAEVLLMARFEPHDTLQAIGRESPTLTLQVPATLRALIEQPDWAQAPLGSLRAVWAGSSVLPDALLMAFHGRGLPVCNVYGATETGPFSIALPEAAAMDHVGSCGWPAPGVEVRLQPVGNSAAGTPASGPDAVGEIWVRGPNVVRHYWPSEPAVDAEGYFHSGDLARRGRDGSYTVVGRLKDMIISGGENVYPAEVEQCLAAVPGVAEVAVLGVPDPRWGEAVVATVVRADSADGQALDEAGLLAAIHERIARYKQPRRVVFIDALPKTALGKVQKGELARAINAP